MNFTYVYNSHCYIINILRYVLLKTYYLMLHFRGEKLYPEMKKPVNIYSTLATEIGAMFHRNGFQKFLLTKYTLL